MSAVHFGEVKELLGLSGVAGAALFYDSNLQWNRIPNHDDPLVQELGTDIVTLCREYNEVGREIEELYFCFQSSAWLGIVKDDALLVVHLENGAPLGRVISAGKRFLGNTHDAS